MSSQLHQIQLGYDLLQDRLILTLSTQDFNEYRFWITRQAVRGLWNILIQLLKADEKTRPQQIQEGTKIGELIEKEKAQRQPIAGKYATSMTKRPLGDEPLLLYKVIAQPHEDGGFRLHLEDTQGRSIEFGGNSSIILGLCQLIKKTVQQGTDWNLELKE